MYDSPGDDEFVTAPTYGLLIGDGFSIQGTSFDEVNVYAIAGGYDVTKMYDSPDDDEFYATPVEGAIYSDSFRTRAKFFEEIHGDSSAGGSDTAYLHDTSGRDTFIATPTYAELSGPEFRSQATDFDKVEAHATAGEYDVARLYDSPGDDIFWTTPTFGALMPRPRASAWRVVGREEPGLPSRPPTPSHEVLRPVPCGPRRDRAVAARDVVRGRSVADRPPAHTDDA